MRVDKSAWVVALVFISAGIAFAGSHDGKIYISNIETFVPPQCYTKTHGDSNPCYACHTPAHAPNFLDDAGLQSTYAFAEPAFKNHWTNLFQDRREAIAAIPDKEALAWARTDNYAELRARVSTAEGGYKPDLDYTKGFNEDGFARDGSGWRAIRYAPFVGTFWPTNGSTDDVLIRLPEAFRTAENGKPDVEINKANLALVEASLKLPSPKPGEKETRLINTVIEPIDEKVVGFDLDGDKKLGVAKRIKVLPEHYLGMAASIQLIPRLYPQGTEFFHTVRYLDPDAPGFMAARMKEVRYAKKTQLLDYSRLSDFYEDELEEKQQGLPRLVSGTPGVGFRNDQGWVYLGWIEDSGGKLRPQNDEEQRFCLGCHSTIGVTRDSSFAFPRKLPGKSGWQPQSIVGQKDVPMLGGKEGHVLTYFKRVKGADEFRSNDEMLERYFKAGKPDEKAVRRAGIKGDQDLAWLLLPSRQRALALNKAYMLIVREQSFNKGRDAVVAPVENVHKNVENVQTENGAAGNTFSDGTLLLDFSRPRN